MRIVQWSAPERTIDRREAGEFYDRPLAEPWLFHFATQKLRLDSHAGPFSLKLVFGGAERYDFGTRRVGLTPGQLLFTPAGRSYSSTIDRKTESLSLFVPEGLTTRFWSDSVDDHGAILDGRQDRSPWPVPVAFKGEASSQVASLLKALNTGDSGEIENTSLELLAQSAASWRRTAPLRELAGPRRSATREELIGRVIRARDMIHDLGGVDCRLAALADVACLSVFHFVRVFKEAFDETPVRYARRVRLAMAAELQMCGSSPAQAARAAGYSRPSALRRAQFNQISISA